MEIEYFQNQYDVLKERSISSKSKFVHKKWEGSRVAQLVTELYYKNGVTSSKPIDGKF